MSSTSLNHPCQDLAERIEIICAQRDPKALAHLLVGKDVPPISREGNDPAEVIWYCITRFIQPSGSDWFDPLADIMQQLVEQLIQDLTGKAHALTQTNIHSHSSTVSGEFIANIDDWEQHEPYMYNILLFSSLLPARKGLFGALEQLFTSELPLPVVFESRVMPMLRTSLMAQQTDDRLIEKWLDQYTKVCKRFNTRESCMQEALTLWRAMLLAPPSDDQEFDVQRIHCALSTVLGDTQEIDENRLMFVQIALQQMEQLWGGTPQYWRSIFANEVKWPNAVRQIVNDLWPDPQDADAFLPFDILIFWRQLTLSVRQKVRQVFRSSEATEWNATFFDLHKNKVADRQKLLNLQMKLQEANPGLAPKNVCITSEAEEGEITPESYGYKSEQQVSLSNHTQFEQVTKQIADIEQLLNKRNHGKAYERYQQLIKRQRTTGAEGKHLSKTLAKIATLFLGHSNNDRAEEIFRDAVKENPNDVVAHSGLAGVFKVQERYTEAEALYREIIALHPKEKVACSGLADVLKEQERYKEAETLYRETIKKYPNDVVARNGLAGVLKAQECYDEAESFYRRTMKKHPGDVVARSGLADLFKVQERYDEAETLYRETTEQHPNNAIVRNGLAEVLKAQECYAEAEVFYRETMAQYPNNVVARCGLADVLKSQERYDEAASLYRETMKKHPNDVVVRNGLAEVLKAEESYDEAASLYRETMKKHPNNVVARNGLAEVLKALERYDEVESLYRKTMAQHPSNAAARNGLAEVLKVLERYDEAESLYRETIMQHFNNAVARNGLANLLRKRNRLDEAERLLSAQRSSNRERQRFDEVVLALIDVKRGRFDQAIRRITYAASHCARKTPKSRLLALAASIELRRNNPLAASGLMTNAMQSNDEAVRLIAWHVKLATSENNKNNTVMVASQGELKLVSARAKKVEEIISVLFNSGQSLCENDELFESECDLLAA